MERLELTALSSKASQLSHLGRVDGPSLGSRVSCGKINKQINKVK